MIEIIIAVLGIIGIITSGYFAWLQFKQQTKLMREEMALARAAQEIDSEKARQQQNQQTTKFLQELITQNNKSLDDRDKRLELKDRELDELQHRHQVTLERYAEADGENNMMRGQLAHMQLQIDQLTAQGLEDAKLRGKYEVLEERFSSLDRTITGLQREASRQTARLKLLQDEKERLQQENKKLEAENKRLLIIEAEVQTLRETNAALILRIEQLEQKEGTYVEPTPA